MCISLQYFLKSHIRFWVWGVLVWDGVRQHWWVKEKSGLQSYLPSTTSQQQIPHCRILQGVRPQRSWAEYHWCANKRATHFGNHNDPGVPFSSTAKNWCLSSLKCSGDLDSTKMWPSARQEICMLSWKLPETKHSKHRKIMLAFSLKQVNSFLEHWNQKIISRWHSDMCNGRRVITVFFVSFERYARQRIIRWFWGKR